ncbi:MAG: hypothetical protein ABMA26_00895 [Limisphaerales bacterium]
MPAPLTWDSPSLTWDSQPNNTTYKVMPNYNRISAILSAADKPAVLVAFQTTKTKLPLLINLTPAGRQSIPRWAPRATAWMKPSPLRWPDTRNWSPDLSMCRRCSKTAHSGCNSAKFFSFPPRFAVRTKPHEVNDPITAR